ARWHRSPRLSTRCRSRFRVAPGTRGWSASAAHTASFFSRFRHGDGAAGHGETAAPDGAIVDEAFPASRSNGQIIAQLQCHFRMASTIAADVPRPATFDDRVRTARRVHHTAVTFNAALTVFWVFI